MTGRLRRWVVIGLLALAIIVAIAAASLPYLPVIHGTTADEAERLATWLDVQPGMIFADLGAGDGTFAVALARRVGPSGHVYATEIDDERLNGIREAVLEARLSNVTVIKGAVSTTNLPEGCCDALLSRLVYHHLTEPTAINADIFRSLRPGGRLMIIDFEPGGIINWISRPETADRHGGHGTPKETVIKEVMLAGFQLLRGPESWRGRTYAVLFRRPDFAVIGRKTTRANLAPFRAYFSAHNNPPLEGVLAAGTAADHRTGSSSDSLTTEPLNPKRPGLFSFRRKDPYESEHAIVKMF